MGFDAFDRLSTVNIQNKIFIHCPWSIFRKKPQKNCPTPIFFGTSRGSIKLLTPPSARPWVQAYMYMNVHTSVHSCCRSCTSKENRLDTKCFSNQEINTILPNDKIYYKPILNQKHQIYETLTRNSKKAICKQIEN